MRLAVLATVITLAITATAAALAGGGAGAPITSKILAGGTIAQPYTIHTTRAGGAVIASAKVAPGGDFGWHSHRAFVAVLVTGGTLTLYDSADQSCTPQRISAGQGFVEQPNHVHLARNEGTKPVTLYVTYLGLPAHVKPDVPAKSPGNCPF
jgi:quercetin dioxygenase-like cupin family protein